MFPGLTLEEMCKDDADFWFVYLLEMYRPPDYIHEHLKLDFDYATEIFSEETE